MSATTPPPLFQAFRPVYNVNTPTNPLPLPDAIKIGVNYDSKIKDNIILWSDICTAFKNPLFVRNDGALVPFLKDENFEPRKPLRILARPNIVFEAVLEVPIDLQKPGETDSPHPASTTIVNPAQGTSSGPQLQNVGSSNTVTPTPDLHDLPPQYTREGSTGSSVSDNIPPRIGGSTFRVIPSGSTVSDSSTSGTSTLGSTALGSTASRNTASGSTASGSTASGGASSGGAASGTTPLANSLSGRSTSSASQSAAATNSNAGVREVGILRYTAGQGSDDYELGLKLYFGKGGTAIDYGLAMFWITQAADLGHVAAQYYLAYMLENGQGSAINITAAVSGYIDAGSRGYDLNRHKPRTTRGNNPGKLAKALHWYGEAADRGDAKAQCVLGFLHQYDKGSPKRYSIAKEWYTKAVNQGYDNAQNNLGVLYYNGNCGARDYSKSFELYTKAALQGHARAQYNLGQSYEYGMGVPENLSEAVRWYTNSAKQRFSRALHRLGTMYLGAHGVQQDIPKAFKLIRESAAQGDDVGQLKLGNMYYFGHGVSSDISTAKEWWRKAADQGNTEARSNLTEYLFRPVYNGGTPMNSSPLLEMVKIESRFDNKTQEYIILWNDVCTAFKNPLHVRNEGVLVPFLTDENFEPCKPLRIRAHANVVLDVILESPENTMGSRVADTIHPESVIIDNQIRGNSSTLQPRVGDVEDTGTLISNLLGLPPQYTREDSSVNSATSLSNRVASTNTNSNTSGADILRNTTTEGSHDYERGLEYYYGKGVTIDYNVAMEWFKEAAGQGHVAAQYYLGFMFENGYGAAQDPAIAVSWYTKAGAKGYDNDNRNTDMVQGNSLGRLDKALKWYRRAADRGDAKAQCVLGFMYQYGKGSLRNHRTARDWYTKAANQGYDNAQNNLGIMCASGEGGTKDYSEALELFFKAGFQGHARAQSNLGLSYESGLGVAYDPTKAVEWYIKSANQGNARSQYRLGILYLEGDGVQLNIPKGLDLIRRSAIQGNASAQNKLGNMYHEGEGVQRNHSLAREWWERSAKQGNASASSNLQKFP